MNFTQFAKIAEKSLKRHAPEILTGIGVSGMIAATIMAVRATPKALDLIREEQIRETEDRGTVYSHLTNFGKAKACWKCYIPATITAGMSIACIIGASSVNIRRNAALATAYTLSETALKEYKDKVVETIGEKKEKEVRDKIAKAKVDEHPLSGSDVIMTGKGNTLCLDSHSGRYFRSDIETINRVVNELNRRLVLENTISLNEFYYEVGMSGTYIGDHLAWSVDRGLIEVSFSAQLAEDNITPCIVVTFITPPSYDY